MSEHENAEETRIATQDPNACISCGNPHYEDGYSNKLCTDCRDKYSKFPIPNWIKLFALGIVVLVIIGLARMYEPMMATISLKRAIKAEQERRYLTAARELKKVLAIFPESIGGNAYAFLADFYNLDMKLVDVHIGRLRDKNFEDKELLAKVEYAYAEATVLIPKDTLNPKILEEIPLDSVVSFERFMQKCRESDSTDLCMTYLFADRLYDIGQYDRSEQMLNGILKLHPDFPGGLPLMCVIKREQGKYDEALAICDKEQALNIEIARPNAQKARIELKRKHDKEAARYAELAMSMEHEDTYSMESLAMVDFYAGKKEESMKLLAQIKELEKPSTVISKRLEDILTGKVNFR